MKELILENWGTILFILLIIAAIFIEPKLPKKENIHKKFKQNEN